MLEQRGYWFAADGYDKPALATAPTPWKVGFHGRERRRLNIDPDLRLIHLHRIDYELCRERHRRSGGAGRGTSGTSGAAGGSTTGSPSDEEFERWYYTRELLRGGPRS